MGHTVHENCLLKQAIEEKIGGEDEDISLCFMTITEGKLEEEALDSTLWSTRSGRGYGPLLRQTAC